MVPTLKLWIFLKLVFVSSKKQFTDQHCSPAEAWPPLWARSSQGGKEDRQVTALSVQPSRAWLTVPITVDLLPQLAHICNMEDISKMEGKTIRNIQSTQQNLLASRHFPPFSVLLISCPSSQTSVEFLCKWPLGSKLSPHHWQHVLFFSMGSFISSHTNKWTNTHVLIHNHRFSF